jgi:hypothetical protein
VPSRCSRLYLCDVIARNRIQPCRSSKPARRRI